MSPLCDPGVNPPDLTIHGVGESPNPINVRTAAYHEALQHTFTIPAVGSTALIAVRDATHYCVGMWIWMVDAGMFQVTALSAANYIQVLNTGMPGNGTPAVVIASGTEFMHTAPNHPIVLADQETGLSLTNANDVLLATVTFNQPFTAATTPIVTVCIDYDGNFAARNCTVWVRDVSNTSFKIYGRNDAVTTQTINVNWIAVGQR